MNDKLMKLLELLDLLSEIKTYEGKLNEIIVNKADNSWFFDIEFDKVLEMKDFLTFVNRLELLPEKLTYITKTDFKIKYLNNDYSLLCDYYDFVLRRLTKKKPRFSSILDFEITQNNKRLEVICPKDGTFVTDLLYDIKKELQKVGFDATLATKINMDGPLIKDRMIKSTQEFINIVSQTTELSADENIFVGFNDVVIRKIKHKISDIPITENDLIEYKSVEEKAFFTFEGEVVSVDFRKISDKTSLFTFIVSDEEDSVYVKKFVKQDVEYDFLNKTKVGMGMKVQGHASFDKFSDEVSVTATVIQRTKFVNIKDHRKDLEKEKRVELHLHSKMSTLDGITAISDYVETAKKWGHKAIALTDHANVQAFPEFYKATKDRNIKPIYGVELTFVDDFDLQIVKEPIDMSFDDAVFTVFDIETTGLSVNFDKIIEIAAVKIKNNQIIEEFQTYVNPERSLSALTTKITSIKNPDVALAPKIDEVIVDFKEFFKGTIMVAHNAHFDMGFIYSVLKEFNLYDDAITSIDTLQIARNCYGDKLKRFNLKAVSRYFKVELVQHHRAIYDTRATADIFLQISMSLINYQ